jgi:hypothetical protein
MEQMVVLVALELWLLLVAEEAVEVETLLTIMMVRLVVLVEEVLALTMTLVKHFLDKATMEV